MAPRLTSFQSEDSSQFLDKLALSQTKLVFLKLLSCVSFHITRLTWIR